MGIYDLGISLEAFWLGEDFDRHLTTNRKSIQHIYVAAIETQFGDPATKFSPRFRVSDFRYSNEGESSTATGFLIH
jgi:hypothetical protein